jgi:Right handed beta helix region
MQLARHSATRRRSLGPSLAACAAGALLGVGTACAYAPAERPAEESRRSEGRSAATASAATVSAAPGACTKYAAPWGRDSNRGTKRRPFRTAQRLADSLRPGQTGCLRGGVYDQTDDGYVLKVDRGGRAGAPVSIRSYPGERAKLVGRIEIPEGSNHVGLSRLVIRGTPGEISVKIYSADVVVARNNISNLRRGKTCIMLGSDEGGQAVRTIIRRNRFHECGRPEDDNLGHGIYAQNVVGASITRNVFWRMQAYAIQFYPHARQTRFAYNVIDGGAPSVRGGIVFGGNDAFASTGNIVERNVIAYARTANIASGWDDRVGTGNVARRNCVWGARDENIDTSDGGFVSRGNVVARPRFVNRAGRDYRLKKGSRCRRVVGFSTVARVVAPSR